MASVCTLQGTVIGPDGAPAASIGVRARMIATDRAPVFTDDGELVNQANVETQTDENGFFEMNVVRGPKCVITIDFLGYSRQVTIPDQATVNLKDL